MNLENFERMNGDILFGIVNMKLRDEVESLEDLCVSYDIDREKMVEKLLEYGYHYHDELRQFRRV